MRLGFMTIKVFLAGLGMAVALMSAPASAQALLPGSGTQSVIGSQVSANELSQGTGAQVNDSSAQRTLGQISDSTEVAGVSQSSGLAVTGSDIVGMIGIALALVGGGVLLLRGRDMRRSNA